MDKMSQERIRLLHPELARRATQLLQHLSTEGIEARVVQSLRSWAEQDILYQQGRTRPGAIVTKCKPGYSWHNFGLAFDCMVDDPDKPGFQLEQDAAHPHYINMVKIGLSLGLRAGANFRTFPDTPHFELTGKWGPLVPEEVRQLFRDGGISAVWEESGLPSS